LVQKDFAPVDPFSFYSNTILAEPPGSLCFCHCQLHIGFRHPDRTEVLLYHMIGGQFASDSMWTLKAFLFLLLVPTNMLKPFSGPRPSALAWDRQ